MNESPIKPTLPTESPVAALLKREGATEVKVVQTRKERGEDAAVVKEDEADKK